jgi:hypothetical protein
VAIRSPTGEQHLAGDRCRHQPRQPHCAVVGQDAQSGLGKEELCVVGRHHHVGCHGDLETAAHRHAVHRSDHRSAPGGQIGEAAETARAVVAVERLALRGCAEVPAGAEEALARSREDRHSHGGVVLEPDERLTERVTGGGIDGVRLRPVERDHGDAVGHLDMESVVLHVNPPR